MSASAPNSEFSRAMAPVARELLGEPNRPLSNRHQLRYGSRGSLSIDLDKGAWVDHEAGVGVGGGVVELVQREKRTDRDGAFDWLREHGHLPKDIAATYDYHAADGTLLFQVVRRIPKDFRQRKPNGAGGWVWKMTGVQRVIYRLEEAIAAIAAGRTIYIAEGEKAVEALVALECSATCSPGGAGKWRKEYGEPLAGAHVVILPDSDDPGRAHAVQVAKALTQIAASIKVLDLPGLLLKADVADWIDSGGTRQELERLTVAAPLAADWLREVPPPAAARTPKTAAASSESGSDERLPYQQASAELRDRLARNDRGAILPSHANLALILRGDPLLFEIVEYNAFTGLHMLRRAVPVIEKSMPPARGPYPRAWDDEDVVRLTTYLQKLFAHGFRKQTVEDCLRVEGRDHELHDVRDFLDGLRWDCKPRLDGWLTMTLGCEPNRYHQAVASKTLIAAVRRVRQPGVKFDTLLVLEGQQGIGKSTVILTLFGAVWVTDQVSDLAKKDSAIDLRGKWCAELPEIEQLIRTEVETIKAFLSRSIDHYRPPYGRTSIDVPRQCVLIGTTNSTEYLRDATGNRRFWPVRCRSGRMADLAWLRANRDQLWAEAAVREAAGESIWLDDKAAAATALQAQADRLADDPWKDRITAHLVGLDEVTVTELFDRAIFVPAQHQTKAAQMRVADVLKSIGWQKNAIWDPITQRTVKRWRPVDAKR